MREIKAYEFLLEAITPIAHHAESFGNHAVIMRRKIRLRDGAWANVPVITGDTLRHQLREAAAYAFLDAAGILGDGVLSESAMRLLFNGGMVTGRGDGGSVRLDDYRTMCDLVPPLALLGGCASSRVIPGRIVSEDAVLICAESRELLPPWIIGRAGEISGARAHVEIAQRVRMDSALDPSKRKLLAEGQVNLLEAKDRRKEEAHAVDDIVASDKDKSTMLPRTFETVVAGSLFSWRVQATCISDLDVDTFHTMIAAFLSAARVGGKRGTGHGLIRAVEGRGVVVNRPSENLNAIDVTALAPKLGELFRAHVKERAEKARTFLREVDA